LPPYINVINERRNKSKLTLPLALSPVDQEPNLNKFCNEEILRKNEQFSGEEKGIGVKTQTGHRSEYVESSVQRRRVCAQTMGTGANVFELLTVAITQWTNKLGLLVPLLLGPVS